MACRRGGEPAQRMVVKGREKGLPEEAVVAGVWYCQGRRQWHPTPVPLPGKSRGWRRLVGCSPWGQEESNMTERLYFHFSLSCIGEGNGNPLQCSCLEKPRDRGAWWASVYGVAQSWTRLTRLSISSSGRNILHPICIKSISYNIAL